MLKEFGTQLRLSVVFTVLFTVLTGLAYPGLVTAVGGVLFHHQATGSFITVDGKCVGSELIGQVFDQPKYFWSRPSATSPNAYNAASSSGSNLGPTNPVLLDAVRDRVTALQSADPHNNLPIPMDLVTTSASGLDPHISPEAAQYQAARVARARGLNPTLVENLVQSHLEGRLWGFLGEPRVNVLKLNLALDNLSHDAKP